MANTHNTPAFFQEAVAIVQGYFPQLQKVHIAFSTRDLSKVKRFSTMLRCHPISLGSPRRYGIIVNSNFNGLELDVREIPATALVGLLAHEFAHIIDYEQKGTGKLIVMFARYRWSKTARRKIEHQIDGMVIDCGLGTELKAWAQYTMFDSNASDAYKRLKRDIYLSPLDIQERMDALLANN